MKTPTCLVHECHKVLTSKGFKCLSCEDIRYNDLDLEPSYFFVQRMYSIPIDELVKLFQSKQIKINTVIIEDPATLILKKGKFTLKLEGKSNRITFIEEKKKEDGKDLQRSSERRSSEDARTLPCKVGDVSQE